MAGRLDHSRDAKIEKRHKLEALGVDPHPHGYARTHTIQEALSAQGQRVRVAGRIMGVREHGKLSFVQLTDATGTMQILCKADALGAQYEQIGLLDSGDFLGAEGVVDLSKSGQVSVFAETMTVLGKSLRPLPSAWQGMEDQEVRYRKRYLDMLIDPEVKKILDVRWLAEKELRRYLQDEHDFVEVETPVLQPLYGGTNAKPFTTHMNALDTDFYLRIAPELYLKRLIVGGYERVFEIARNFRNEGIDQTHQPEFTMVEWYEAYADYQRMMDVAEGLFRHLVQKVHGTSKILVGTEEVDVGKPWPRIRMQDAIRQFLNLDTDAMSDEDLASQLTAHQLKLTGAFTRAKAIFSLFDHLVPKLLIQPTWIIDYPKEVSPLAKQHRTNPELVERFEGYIGGKELCDGWSEVTDALEQRRRFEVEQHHLREGDEEAQPTDEEFLEAMEYGMPPLGGIGIGIDRLIMFLTNTWMIKEVIAFPTLRPANAPVSAPTAPTQE